MASYNSNQLYGAGAPIEALTSGSTYTFAITSSASGSTYFTLESVRNSIGYYDSSSSATAAGTIENLTNITGLVASPYIFSTIVQPGGGSFTFTPATNVVASGSFLRGTGGISLDITSLSGGLITNGLIIQLDAYNNSSYPGTGTTVYDITSGYDHTLIGATYTVLNGVKCFDCTTGNNRIDYNATGPTLPNSGYTYITWAKLIPSNDVFRTLLYTKGSPKITPITIPNASNTLGYWATGFVSSGYDVASLAGDWVQFAIVGTNTSQTFYINGSEVGNTINQGAGGTTHWGWGNNDIVAQPWGHVANMYFYDRQLSLEEITQQYNYLAPRFVEPTTTTTTTAAPTTTSTTTTTTTSAPTTISPVLYYDPSNPISYPGSGSTVTNITGSAPNGTLSNISFTNPYFTYNGTTSTVSIGDNISLEPGSGDFTVETWINPASITGNARVILAKTDGGGAQDWGYGLRISNTGNAFFEVGNGVTSVTSPVGALTANTWVQIVGVWTNIAANTLVLYINGVSQGTRFHSFSSVKNTSRPLFLGSFDGGFPFGQWFNGQMGIVRIYNSALTSTQILQAYNNDKTIYGL
jgi:hypothetical protein